MSFSGSETRTCVYCKKSVTYGCIVPDGWRQHEAIEGFKGLAAVRKFYDVCSERCEKLFMGLRIVGGQS